MTEADMRSAFQATADNFLKLQEMVGTFATTAQLMTEKVKNGGKVIFCGNGGSAADAQHLAAELMGRFLIDRAPLAAMALSVNTSTITAIGNDFGYDEVFERQLRGVGRAGDVLVGISTSGNSVNVVRALEAANEIGILTVGLTGAGGGRMKEICQICHCVPSSSTPRIQEMHIAIGHSICEWIEAALA